MSDRRRIDIFLYGLCPDNAVTFPMRSWCLVGIRFNKYNYLADMHFSPMAEVSGSNPFWCANDFNWLLKFICQRFCFAHHLLTTSGYFEQIIPL